jgi:hypothetical protein
LYPHSRTQLSFPFESHFLDIHSPNIEACRERLAMIYDQANDQATNDVSGRTPRKGATEQIHRTISPVSVMAAPQPIEVYHSVVQQMDDSMDAEYSDDEDL